MRQGLLIPHFPFTFLSRSSGFKDALIALTVLKHPELEQQGGEAPLQDLVFNHLLVQPELEGVRDMAWLQAKVTGERNAFRVYVRCKMYTEYVAV